MLDHDALGGACGAGGIDDVGQVGGLSPMASGAGLSAAARSHGAAVALQIDDRQSHLSAQNNALRCFCVSRATGSLSSIMKRSRSTG